MDPPTYPFEETSFMNGPLGKIFLKFLHVLTMLFLLMNVYFWSQFSNKNDMVSAWRNFKNIFHRPLFIIIFRPKMLKFHPYSILTGDTRVEFVIYCVLNTVWTVNVVINCRILVQNWCYWPFQFCLGTADHNGQ